MLARIFRPAKNAMQSGKGQTELWVLEYEPEAPLRVDPLMGYTSSTDMRRQIRLEFPTSAEAIAYADRHGIPYRLFEDHDSAPKRLSYSDNFRFSRPTPWTH